MPELPEVETIVQELDHSIAGDQITSVHVHRSTPIRGISVDDFTQRLKGRLIQSVRRRAKYLIFDLQSEELIAHLRMTGKFVVASPPFPANASHRVAFQLQSGRVLIYNDLRCLGTLTLNTPGTIHPWLEGLGVEPLSEECSLDVFKSRFATISSPIKPLLLDQSKIVGIGNIYAAEILFESGVSPLRLASKIRAPEWQKLNDAMRLILQTAIAHNGTSISDFRRVDEKQGEFQHLLKVYGKQGKPCPVCHSTIERIVQQQRSSFYCPQCQE